MPSAADSTPTGSVPRIDEQVAAALSELDPRSDSYAVHAVDSLLQIARSAGASDLHLLPVGGAQELRLLFRIDGVLQTGGIAPQQTSRLVARLKVLANLLTYRTDVPQEGRIRSGEEHLEMRVSTFPTVHGEKAVVRFFVGSGRYRYLADLSFPAEIEQRLNALLLQTEGLFLVCGPSGSGKTTTLYAALRHIQRHSEALRSICTLEDPIEALLSGISQSQVKPEGEFTYERGLASLMRQDPEVIMVGEIRNRVTAQVVFQASLTGQLVLSSFHAGTAADAISRLSDMGIEPYVLRSGLLGILAQRLVRRSCACRQTSAAGCPECRQSGYRGRLVLAELLLPELKGLGRAILDRQDAEKIQDLAIESGMIPLRERGRSAVEQRLTTDEELRRVFGPMLD